MFLSEAPVSPAVDALFTDDRSTDGYVMNLTRLWAWRPDVRIAFDTARSTLQADSALTGADIAVLVAATASARRDSYCALAWGRRLAERTDVQVAESVVAGSGDGLNQRASALVAWAHKVANDPNSTTEQDVAQLRMVGLGDREIFEATTLIAFRLAFSTVNDALAALPDRQLAEAAPEPVRRAVDYGRDVATARSE